MFVAEAQNSSKCSDISCQSQCIHDHSPHIGSATAAAEYAAALAAILDSFGGPVTSNSWNKLAVHALEPAHSSAATQHATRSVHSATNTPSNGLQLQSYSQSPASISSSGFAQQHSPNATATAATDGADRHASPETNDMDIQPAMHKPVAYSLPTALSELALSKEAALLTIPAPVPTHNIPHGAYMSSLPDDDTLGLPVFDMPVSRRLPPNLPFWSLDDSPAPPTPTPVASTPTPCTAHVPSPAATYQAFPTAPSGPEETTLPVYDMPLSCRLPPGPPIWSLDNTTFPLGAASSSAPSPPAASPQHVHASSDTAAANYSSPSSHYRHFFSEGSQQQTHWQLYSQSAPSVHEMQWENQRQQLSVWTSDQSIVPAPAEQHAVQLGPLPPDAAEPSTMVLKKKKGTGNTVSVTPC